MSLANNKDSYAKKSIAGHSTLTESVRASGFKNVLEQVDYAFASGNRSTNRVWFGEDAPGTDYDSVAIIGDKYIQLTYTSGSPTAVAEYLKTANGWDKVLTASDANFFDLITQATITTAGSGTYTAANLLGGQILRDPAGASRTDTTATAAQIVAAIKAASGNCVAGNKFDVLVKNTADADETITLAGGTGVTLSPAAITIRKGGQVALEFVVTNAAASSEAVACYLKLHRGDAKQDSVAYVTGVFDGVDTAPNVTAAQILDGIIIGTPTAARNYTLPAAADLLALLPNAVVGTTIEFSVVNKSSGAYAINIVASSSITNGGLSGHLGVTQNTSATFKIRFTNVTASSEAAILYRC